MDIQIQKIRRKLQCELIEGQKRQRPKTMQPSGFMHGISRAIQIVDAATTKSSGQVVFQQIEELYDILFQLCTDTCLTDEALWHFIIQDIESSGKLHSQLSRLFRDRNVFERRRRNHETCEACKHGQAHKQYSPHLTICKNPDSSVFNKTRLLTESCSEWQEIEKEIVHDLKEISDDTEINSKRSN